jgi:hydroxymethylpyrimidine/phosphomethylpyrimidine kinase
VFSDLAVKAVKIGMLSQPDVIRDVAAGLDRYQDHPRSCSTPSW